MNKTRQTTVPVIAFSIGLASFAGAAVTAFSRTFYSTNTGLTSPSSNVVFTTPAASNAEMHTGFTNTTINLGETFRINFNISFNSTNGLGGHRGDDGLRFGLLRLTTPTNADGTHTTTTATGYSTRFNWVTGVSNTAGDIRPRTIALGTSPNYVTTSGVYGGANTFTGFGLTANGTAYDASYSVTRTTATANRVDFTINGITRSWTDNTAAAFNFDTFVIAKIGDDPAVFNTASTITLNSFVVVPEPSGIALLGCSAIGLILRRRR